MTGPEELRRWIETHDLTVTEAALVIGLPRNTLHAYLSGHRAPSIRRKLLLRKKAGVSVASWEVTSLTDQR